jgi:hypothetical protein
VTLNTALAACDCADRWTDQKAAAWWEMQVAVEP